jgi:arylformamidase
MSFDDLPKQTAIYPAEAQAYADRALELSRIARGTVSGSYDIPYGADYWQRVDVYTPSVSPSSLAPVLVFAHGGAWTHGYKEWMGLMAPAVTQAEIVFVSVSYRLAPTQRFPAALEDCAAALQWVYSNIHEHGGDIERIAVGGHSAGGHLYGLLSLRQDLIKAYELPESVIKACFPVSSQMNLVFDNPPAGSGEARIYEMFLARADQAPSASPLHQVTGRARMPFHLYYGEKDFPRIIKSNIEFFEALKASGTAVTAEVVPSAEHFDTALQLADSSVPWVHDLLTRVHEI